MRIHPSAAPARELFSGLKKNVSISYSPGSLLALCCPSLWPSNHCCWADCFEHHALTPIFLYCLHYQQPVADIKMAVSSSREAKSRPDDTLAVPGLILPTTMKLTGANNYVEWKKAVLWNIFTAALEGRILDDKDELTIEWEKVDHSDPKVQEAWEW